MKNLAAALIKAQLEMDPLRKDAKNPAFGKDSKYASLAGVQEVALPALAKHEVAVMQSVSTEWNETVVLVKVGCTLFHAPSGEYVGNEITLKPVKSDPQGIGSAITYGRRYLLLVMAGLAPEDDDGNEASGKVANKTTQVQASTSASVHRQPEANATPSNGNGAAKTLAIPKTFADAAAAIKWGYDAGAFAAYQHSENAYNKLKEEKKPVTAADMFKLWTEDVQRRLAEKQSAVA